MEKGLVSQVCHALTHHIHPFSDYCTMLFWTKLTPGKEDRTFPAGLSLSVRTGSVMVVLARNIGTRSLTAVALLAATLLLGVLLTPARVLAHGKEPDIARYPAPNMVNDPRAGYAKALMVLAFAETPEDGPGYVVFSDAPMERLRIEAELERGRSITVYMMPGTNAYDSRFLRVAVPVDRGLLGLRIGVIRADSQDRFDEIRTLGDLGQIRIGSVLGWHLTEILRHNGLTTEVVPTFADLYRLLDVGRVDMISRGATEVIREQMDFGAAHPATTIDRSLVLRMPLAFYLYVSAKQPDLHRRLETGLRRAVANGHFDRLFQEWFSGDLDQIGMDRRHVIDLMVPDPHLPTLMMDPKLRLKP